MSMNNESIEKPEDPSPDRSGMPVQKCCRGHDTRSLSDTELLAVVLGSGRRGRNVMDCAGDLMRTMNGLPGILNSGLRELARHEGVGMVKAVRIQCALEMGRRIITGGRELTHVGTPESVWRLLLPEIAGLQKEEFRVLVLNNKNRVLKRSVISVGTVSEALVHPREIFRDAIREGGSAIIVSHNHPSGVLTPSREDIAATERIAGAGTILGIPLLDHVIVSDSSWCSMKEQGYL
jgi:DNA repair protein RadC